MAHFAKLDNNNIVLEVHVVNNNLLLDSNGIECEEKGIQFLTNWSGGTHTNWKQTSYNGNIRKRYAGIGHVYNTQLDAFIPPQPYPSWTLDQNTAEWVSPIPPPESETETYDWDEINQTWILVTSEQ